MYGKIQQFLQTELATIEENGIFKKERIITSTQGAEITVNGETVLNFCANNYLGLSSHPEVVQAAKDTLDSHGFGMSSVRFICGTQDIHKTLEQKIAQFLGTEDTILYAAAFDEIRPGVRTINWFWPRVPKSCTDRFDGIVVG
jgi:glycine C-acetyltransferase